MLRQDGFAKQRKKNSQTKMESLKKKEKKQVDEVNMRGGDVKRVEFEVEL